MGGGRQVTTISIDVHKYGFASKGSVRVRVRVRPLARLCLERSLSHWSTLRRDILVRCWFASPGASVVAFRNNDLRAMTYIPVLDGSALYVTSTMQALPALELVRMLCTDTGWGFGRVPAVVPSWLRHGEPCFTLAIAGGHDSLRPSRSSLTMIVSRAGIERAPGSCTRCTRRRWKPCGRPHRSAWHARKWTSVSSRSNRTRFASTRWRR